MTISKRMLSMLLSLALLITSLSGAAFADITSTVNAAGDVIKSPVMPFTDLDGFELTKEMGAGINLGNTMDGHTGFSPSETIWQNVTTSAAYVKAVHDLGFNTIRVPVTWGNMIDDENDFAISETWISRVQDIVDYAVALDMYVIINVHHDGAEQMGWLRIATDDQDGLKKKFAGVWKNIASRFAAYDEHLIFESMNEVQGAAMSLAQENAVICELNQIFVDTVRATGGNNYKRWLCVPGKYNVINSLVNESGGFYMPEDKAGRIMLSAHDYTPWSFCGTESMDKTDYSVAELYKNNEGELSLLKQFTDAGIPVIIGEYGCIHKNNPEDRALYLEGMNMFFKKYNVIGIYWDQGWYDRSLSPDYSFTIVDRASGKPVEKEVTDAIIRGFFRTDGLGLDELVKSPDITPIGGISTTKSDITLTIGEKTDISSYVSASPADNNDVILYSSEDDNIATVYMGRIRARGIGQTRIRIYSQSGDKEAYVNIKVEADSSLNASDLSLDESEIKLASGRSAYLLPNVSDSYTGGLSFTSDNEDIVSVSPIGKVLAIGEGTANVTVRAYDGSTASVKVDAGASEGVSSITLALNVYYNDSRHDYYQNEVGSETVTVSANGTYTLSFDCEKDLSEAAKSAGVSTLSRLTAIYIKDYDVTKGNASKSPLENCDIIYDEIKVNGVPLTITMTESKSALKSSGIFDTNDPINAWDGSAVEEAKASNQVADFTGIDDPVTIEVTFTLSGMQFKGQDPLPEASDEPEEEPEPEITQPAEPDDKAEEVSEGAEITSPTPALTPEPVKTSDDKSDEGPSGGLIAALIGIAAAVFIGVFFIVRKKKPVDSNSEK